MAGRHRDLGHPCNLTGRLAVSRLLSPGCRRPVRSRKSRTAALNAPGASQYDMWPAPSSTTSAVPGITERARASRPGSSRRPPRRPAPGSGRTTPRKRVEHALGRAASPWRAAITASGLLAGDRVRNRSTRAGRSAKAGGENIRGSTMSANGVQALRADHLGLGGAGLPARLGVVAGPPCRPARQR